MSNVSNVSGSDSATSESGLCGSQLNLGLVRDTTWTGEFGSNHSDSNVGYTLLGQGFFQARTADSLPGIVSKWVTAHPDATIVSAADFGAAPDGTRLLWVWLTDGKNNLNQELVRRGVCQKEAMAIPAGLKPLVTPAQYAAFESELPRLEKLAKEERLGVWK